MTDADPTPPAGPPGVPRWVKISLAVVLAIVVLLVVSKLAGIEHGPGRHLGGASTSLIGQAGLPLGVSDGARE